MGGGQKKVAKGYCIFGNNYLSLLIIMAASGQNPRSRNKSKEMAPTAITRGKQNKVVGKMSAIRVGFCADATIKENNTIYHQGPKKQPGPLYPEVSGTGCRN